MILHSVNYFRDFKYDFPSEFPLMLEKAASKITTVVALLHLLSTIKPLQTPLSIGGECTRSIKNITALAVDFKSQNVNKFQIPYHILQTCLSVSSVALTILTPAYGLIASSISDMIENFKECMSCLNSGKNRKAGEAFARLMLSTLIIFANCYGSIEFTVAAMALQIILGCYSSLEHFRKEEILEGFLNTLTVGIQISQSIPQTKLLLWKYSYQPVLNSILKKDNKGFVYLDIPDKYVKNLYRHFKEPGMELPPYFGEEKAGAHVSVILKDEIQPSTLSNINCCIF